MSAAQHQEFCVRWNSHLGSIGAAFPQLLAGQRFVDVTLACEGHQVHCHRLVLAACSSYFDSILAENPCKHPVIILPSEIKLWEIQALVDFMYKGEVNVTQAGLGQLLRCAEQLRIRGLYGSDAAINYNQLIAMKQEAEAAAASTVIKQQPQSQPHQSTTTPIDCSNMEIDDTGTNDTATTTTTTSTTAISAAAIALTNAQNHQQHMQQKHLHIFQQKEQQQQQRQLSIKQQHQTNESNVQHQQLQQQQHILPQQTSVLTVTAPTSNSNNSNVATEDESADESSTANAWHHRYDDYKLGSHGHAQMLHQLDSTIEEDHNYVAAHDDDDSSIGGGGGVENMSNELETSANSSTASMIMQAALEGSGTFKRVRRSEASLAQAAKCVSKGETFQTVSNMFNIPVSTIRFYMARKGILPKRKRGRGASNNATTTASVVALGLLGASGGVGGGGGVIGNSYITGTAMTEHGNSNIISSTGETALTTATSIGEFVKRDLSSPTSLDLATTAAVPFQLLSDAAAYKLSEHQQHPQQQQQQQH